MIRTSDDGTLGTAICFKQRRDSMPLRFDRYEFVKRNEELGVGTELVIGLRHHQKSQDRQLRVGCVGLTCLSEVFSTIRV